MFAKPGMKETDPVAICNGEKYGLNFCRVLALKGEDESDLIVSAGRRGGIGFTRFQEGIRRQIMHAVKFNDLDIVDICSIATPNEQRAVAAAGRDGSLVLFRDILNDQKPRTFKFGGVKGAVYRVLSARGDIYLVTSNGLFALFQLAGRFHSGLTLGEFNVLKFPVEAADANLVDQRWLLATGINELFKFDITKIPRSPEESGEVSWGEPNAPDQGDLIPLREESTYEQNSERMAPA